MNVSDIVDIVTQLVMPLKRRIIMSISRANINSVDDSEGMQLAQVSIYADETREDQQRMQEFGFSSLPPKGTEGIIVFPGGNRERGVIIATNDRKTRPTDLADGETIIYDAEGNSIHLKAGGEIEIKCTSKVTLNTPVVELGPLATEAIIKGDLFKAYFDTHTHVSGSPGSPSSPPVVPMPSATLSTVSTTT